MKQSFRKSMALFMAFVVLFTTMSFAVDMHYCGDTLVDFSLVKHVKTCGMEQEEVASTCENPTITQKSCCTDSQVLVQGQDDLNTPFDQLTFEQQTFITALAYSYVQLFESYADNVSAYEVYRPPLVHQNLLVLHQTFRI